MPYTVLKVAKLVKDQIEVAGEFPSEEKAQRFAEAAERGNRTHDYEYLIESPPSKNPLPIKRSDRTPFEIPPRKTIDLSE